MRWAVLLLLAVPAGAADGELGAGNEAFWKGDFAGAAERYRRVVKGAPDSADAWFNLGTAEASARRIGPAVHAFEQALLLRPGDADAVHNLAQTRAAAIAEGVDAGEGARLILPGDDDLGTGLLTAVAPNTLSIAFAVTWALLFALLALWRRADRSGMRTALSFAAVVVGLGVLASGGLLSGRVLVVDRTDFGVVVARKAQVHAGPGAQYATSARLVGGVKVRLRSTDAGWLQVTLPDGSEGWLEAKSLAELRRP